MRRADRSGRDPVRSQPVDPGDRRRTRVGTEPARSLPGPVERSEHLERRVAEGTNRSRIDGVRRPDPLQAPPGGAQRALDLLVTAPPEGAEVGGHEHLRGVDLRGHFRHNLVRLTVSDDQMAASRVVERLQAARQERPTRLTRPTPQPGIDYEQGHNRLPRRCRLRQRRIVGQTLVPSEPHDGCHPFEPVIRPQARAKPFLNGSE